jgi:hypothetical protein
VTQNVSPSAASAVNALDDGRYDWLRDGIARGLEQAVKSPLPEPQGQTAGLELAHEWLAIAQSRGATLPMIVSGASLLIAGAVVMMDDQISRAEFQTRSLHTPERRFNNWMTTVQTTVDHLRAVWSTVPTGRQ